MSTRRRSVATALAAAAAVTGTLLTTAPPAQAAPTHQCKATSHTLPLPAKPDVKVTIDLCVSYVGSSGSYRNYEAWVRSVRWDGTGFATGGKRLNEAYILVRIEHNDRPTSDTATEYIGAFINGKEAGVRRDFYDHADYNGKTRGWTADGILFADVADDGKGYLRRELSGTRAVS